MGMTHSPLHSARAEKLLPIQMGSLPRTGSALILSSLRISQKRWAFLRKCWQSSMRVSLVITLTLSHPLSPPSVQATHGESKKRRDGVMLAILGGLWVMTARHGAEQWELFCCSVMNPPACPVPVAMPALLCCLELNKPCNFCLSRGLALPWTFIPVAVFDRVIPAKRAAWAGCSASFTAMDLLCTLLSPPMDPLTTGHPAKQREAAWPCRHCLHLLFDQVFLCSQPNSGI